jgi:rare lipoprotein A (peptidoglycan hydrolase)
MVNNYRRAGLLLTLIVCMLQTTNACVADEQRSSGQHSRQQTLSGSAQPSHLYIADNDAGQKTFSGNASWYGAQFNGKRTASGELFDMNKLSAAHLHLPLPTKVLVENPRSGKSAVVRVNDRGPYHTKRVMDLSRQAAKDTGIFSYGVGYIECTVLTKAK